MLNTRQVDIHWREGGNVYGARVFVGHGRVLAHTAGKLVRGSTGNAEPPPMQVPKKTKGCRGCESVSPERWLGLWWYGTPMPLRLFRRGPHEGCGCIVILKDLWTFWRQRRRQLRGLAGGR